MEDMPAGIRLKDAIPGYWYVHLSPEAIYHQDLRIYTASNGRWIQVFDRGFSLAVANRLCDEHNKPSEELFRNREDSGNLETL